ncbi:hypothetical protein UFOVP407_34 [uncultured Caudovirales phage]|uniref:Uncharacterized protein n=1 Tax=uncultured Caudovirales phage TaxID=2100421 RepID=A0A6J5M073_9CAUD|nr:hypothetical protein UFOVP407_34 [uncultured Caudovirales phage]
MSRIYTPDDISGHYSPKLFASMAEVLEVAAAAGVPLDDWRDDPRAVAALNLPYGKDGSYEWLFAGRGKEWIAYATGPAAEALAPVHREYFDRIADATLALPMNSREAEAGHVVLRGMPDVLDFLREGSAWRAAA